MQAEAESAGIAADAAAIPAAFPADIPAPAALSEPAE